MTETKGMSEIKGITEIKLPRFPESRLTTPLLSKVGLRVVNGFTITVTYFNLMLSYD